MWINKIYRWLAALLLSMVIPVAGTAGQTQSLQELVDGRRCDDYVPVPLDRLQLAEAAFVALLQTPAAVDDGVLADWQALGFRLRRITAGNAVWLLLHQDPGQCSGQGLYLIRQDAAANLALQVPHGYFDQYTDDIAAGLLQAPVRVIAFNTARRNYTRHGSKVDADLAHRSDNFFTPLTRAFARVFPYGRLVQLHGFNPAKRKSQAGQTAVAIISSGSGTPSRDSTAVAACLQPLLGGPVRLYPTDVRELGGTKNMQGRLLRAHGHDGFVHVELSHKIRERLRADDALRGGFAACLSSRIPIP
jgi:hypothetical protein